MHLRAGAKFRIFRDGEHVSAEAEPSPTVFVIDDLTAKPGGARRGCGRSREARRCLARFGSGISADRLERRSRKR
jgi:hypothetical protein